MAALLTGWRFLIALALPPLLAPQAVVLLERGPLLLAPVLGATLLAAAELAFWSIGARPPGKHSRRLLVTLVIRVWGLSVGGAVLGWLVLAISGLKTAGSLDLTFIGSVDDLAGASGPQGALAVSRLRCRLQLVTTAVSSNSRSGKAHAGWSWEQEGVILEPITAAPKDSAI
ncbi:MAG: hypothetical protein ACYDC5_03885 [Candidatus Dormibacteria bacterium]